MKWELPRNPGLRRLCKRAQKKSPTRCTIEFYNNSNQKGGLMRDFNVLPLYNGIFLLVDFNYQLDARIEKAYDDYISLIKERDFFTKLTERDEEKFKEDTE